MRATPRIGGGSAFRWPFGPGSLRAVAMVLFIPTLVIIPLIVPQFQTETLAALLGTVAGYVLSKTDNKD